MTEILNQQSILQRIAASDKSAVQECIDKYGGLVWSLARRLAFNDAEAEDAVQEIFIELWKSAGRFDPTQSGEVIVPINAKLKITKPTLFAVTIEKPGGVVVSKRDKLILTAKV